MIALHLLTLDVQKVKQLEVWVQSLIALIISAEADI
jgi:hypothetical protein